VAADIQDLQRLWAGLGGGLGGGKFHQREAYTLGKFARALGTRFIDHNDGLYVVGAAAGGLGIDRLPFQSRIWAKADLLVLVGPIGGNHAATVRPVEQRERGT
jgi:hypothetical protein